MRRRTFTTASVEKLEARGDVAGLVLALAESDEDVRAAALKALVATGADDGPLRFADVLMARPAQLEAADRESMRQLVEAAGKDAAVGPTISHLLSLLGSGGRDARAITMLVWLAPESVQPLIDTLGDAGKGQQAVLGLGYARDMRAVEPLRALMLESPDPDIRRVAAWALGTIGDPASANALLLAGHEAGQDAAGEEAATGEEEDATIEEQEDTSVDEEDVVTDAAPSPYSQESLGSLDFDGLAESYDIAVEAYRSAGQTGNLEEEARWLALATAVVDEARGRLGSDKEPVEGPPKPVGLLTRRRLERQRAQLRAACAQREPGPAAPSPEAPPAEA